MKKTIKDLNAAHKKDKRQSPGHIKGIQEKQLQALRKKLSTLEESYSQRVETLQQQIIGLNEYSYLFSKDILREAQVALAKGDDSKAKDIYTKITQLAKVMDKQAAKAEFNLGKMAEDNIDYRNAYQHYQQAVKRDEHNPEYLLAAGRLARFIALQNQAIDYYQAALAIQIKAKGAESTEVALLWSKLGKAWVNKGQYDKAIGYYEKALASDLKTLGPGHPRIASNWSNLGMAWYRKGQYVTAIGYLDKALASDLKTLGSEHPDVALRWNNLGLALDGKGQYDKAIGYLEKALASDLKTFGLAHPNVSYRWNSLGMVWHSKGQYDKAIGYYEKALLHLSFSLGVMHPTTLSVREKLESAKQELANKSN